MVRPRGSALVALDLAAQIRDGEVTAVEAVDAAIDRCEAENPRLNFLVTECFAQARERASGPLGGPFAGVPMLVKDLTETAGVRTTFSSRAFVDHVPPHSAAVVKRMEAAGFVVIGKSNTPEFGITAVTESDLNGACRNPYDVERTPGGSSGGAAAAVAAGVIPLAHGTDGGGSIRIPASCCGLFGIKPSRGRVSLAPYGSGSLELGQSGPLATNVCDAAAFLDAIAGYEWGDAQWAPSPERPFLDECEREPGRLRIAVTTTPPMDFPVGPAVAQVARDAAERLATLGHDVVEATPPWHDEPLLELFSVLWQLTPVLYGVEDESLLTPLNRFLADRARATGSVDYARAVARLQQLARRVVAFWQDVDVVVTPGLAKLPVPIGWIFEPDDPWEQFVRGAEFTPFTPLVNVTGQPAAMFPFATVDGLPVGVQLIGPPAGEALLFRLCAQLEAAQSWGSPSM